MGKSFKSVYRTHTCGQLRKEDDGREVTLSGWVDTIRDHGGITFVDLRDRFGKTQIVYYKLPQIKLTKESVITIQGKVRLRDAETYNDKISTGEIEVVASETKMLSQCKSVLPFEIDLSRETSEEVRLKYRYLDLRNKKMKDNILFRSEVIREVRKLMYELGFDEFQTPILTCSSPEGARDYLVPSRLHHGQFYALPQAPQQFKQLLMVSGMDRYFQIAPCFRDEDARADRCPGEFYQLDMEMSFATQEDVFAVMEQVLPAIFEKFGKYKIASVPFPRISFRDAMDTYGTDKPDLRNPLVIRDITKVFEKTTFGAFAEKTVKCITAPQASKLSKKTFEDLTSFAIESGAKGLAWVKVEEDMSLTGPIIKFMTEKEVQDLVIASEGRPGDCLFIIADKWALACKIMGLLRTMLCEKLGLLEDETYKFCWIVDFPMYEYNEDEDRIDFCHNPFTMPQGGLEALKTKQPLDILAYQYDIIVNGIELSSGAVRNFDPEIMVKAFEVAGYGEETIKEKFGALYTAFQYGAPPHAGIAPGIDRMIMLLLDEKSIREVVAFPMNSRAQDVMMGAPGFVTEAQLRDVHIKIRTKS